MGRLILISNRLPYSIDKVDDDIIVRQSSGGLVSAIKSYFENNNASSEYSDKIWVGSMDTGEDEWKIVQDMDAMPKDFGIEPVFPDKTAYDNFYNGFSNSTLWPLFHYFPSIVEYKKEYWEDYLKINELFAEKVISIYQPGDVIWVHDYQLMILPDLIRKKIPEATIGFFLHIPFPSYEVYRLLPTEWKKAILRGILGSDLIGFHTHDYVQHFIQSAKMIIKVESQFNTIYYENRIIKTDLFPIGIDYAKFKNAANNDVVREIKNSLEEKFEDQKIIFSVDRLDYTKGLNYRLDGFEEFLNNYPDWREKVVFILNVVPSRDLIPTYSERKRMIEEKVSTINGKFSTLHWQPLIYRYNHLGFEELCALYQVSDVALITPLRDGMNLVAKEYIASCIDKGVLVLSELTGAANELNEAVLVNPTDTSEVATSLEKALTMPLAEQRSRLAYMQKRISEYDVERWINDFLEQLQNIKKDQEGMKINILDKNVTERIINDFTDAQKRCILLDYDGTLAPYHKIPAMASPSGEVLELLSLLAEDPKNEVIVISGRDADTLDKWLGNLPLNLVAEHGACVRLKGEKWQEKITHSPEWKDQIRPLLQLFVSRCAGSFIEEKKNTLAWHYRNTHPDLGFNRSRELKNSLLQLTTNTPLQVVDGNKVLEVRQIGVDKGVTALNMMQIFNPDFVLCLGDDTTDEDMFRAIRERAYTIKIGRGNTAAEFTLLAQTEVVPLLKKLVVQEKKLQYN